MAKVFGFSEDGFRRAKETIRRVLGTPAKGTHRRRQPPVIGGSGGSGSLVLFELVTVDCDAGTATGTALVAACTGTLPTGTQDITDDLGCNLTGAEAILIGQKCWCQESDGAYGCAWSIVSMCCADATC